MLISGSSFLPESCYDYIQVIEYDGAKQMLKQAYDAQAQILKILTHPARLAILDILRDDEHCVCHMEAYLGFRQAYISQQLAVLREAGLIEDRRDGWNIFYRVVDRRIYDVMDAARAMGGEAADRPLKPAAACPCPKCNAV
jgi:DNA-binding transcriptional ArsR family regulator